MERRDDVSMMKLVIIFLLLACYSKAPAQDQTNAITITNLQGTVFRNVVVIKMEKDGVLFRLPDGAGWDRVKFTNMDTALQLHFGYDPEKIRQEEEQKRKKEIAETTEQIKRWKAAQYHAIEAHKYLLEPISKSEFPETPGAEAACKEIAAELKGMDAVLEIGLTYMKFSDLLTEKVQAIEKITPSCIKKLSP